ncbi:lmo0937 family membrane protein [Flavobacterium sp. NRK F10]|uniref:Lmo0937 family membrane protein n=1 Tax=Flavobacterium sediminis TaxID=2201181 RepID=A0A2U8QRE6_9FLAO|nr:MULTISPECIES: lmo0937 family membrane protein [Flavobacterium]AWM12733.1 lmo0937 family membrane protein [Flavobacterium sediminis]MCO6173853.1 lmo0937 family membrane protein [Flavobacterium sp. NRK F10]
MGNLLYLIAVILVILWALGLYVGSFGNLIHILLIIAIIAILLRIINNSRKI